MSIENRYITALFFSFIYLFISFFFCFCIGYYSCAYFSLKVELYLAYFAGSTEETFFDSQAWLESDCEDDYFSVNGGKNTNALSHFSCKHG